MSLFKKTIKEKDIQAHFNEEIKEVKKRGGFHRKLSDRYQSNLPDNLLIYKSKVYLIELKKPGDEPRPGQASVGSEITTAGGTFLWFSSKEGIDGFIKRLIEGEPSRGFNPRGRLAVETDL